jgi:hypothetical protein
MDKKALIGHSSKETVVNIVLELPYLNPFFKGAKK